MITNKFVSMKTETYIMTYTVYFDGYTKDGKMKVENCMSELHAKIRLGDFLKRKYPNQTSIVIHSCKVDIIGQFRNIFGF